MIFVITVVVMVIVAIAAVVTPLLRRGRQLGRPRGVFALAMIVIVVVPLATLGLYLKIGTSATLAGVPTQPPVVSIDQALADLRTHLAQQPDDLQGWLLLAQTTTAMHQPSDARDAYDHVLQLDANNTDAMVGWAEADAMLQSNHMMSDRARALLQQSVTRQPDSQRGLWLLGISQFQQNQFAEAAKTWRHLQPMLQPGSSVATAVAGQIAVADERMGNHDSKDFNAKSSASPQSDTLNAGPALQVNVALAPALKKSIRPGDTLFVYARAPSGSPMPLAVARMDAHALPVSITLNDSMAMTPQSTLSSVSKAFVGARISHSGQAIAQPGDLEGDAGVLAVDTRRPVNIIIDKVH